MVPFSFSPTLARSSHFLFDFADGVPWSSWNCPWAQWYMHGSHSLLRGEVVCLCWWKIPGCEKNQGGSLREDPVVFVFLCVFCCCPPGTTDASDDESAEEAKPIGQMPSCADSPPLTVGRRRYCCCRGCGCQPRHVSLASSKKDENPPPKSQQVEPAFGLTPNDQTVC